MTLLSTKAKLLVLLLALQRRAVVFTTTTLTTTGLGGILDSDVEQVVGVIGRTGGVCLALCSFIISIMDGKLRKGGRETYSSSKH